MKESGSIRQDLRVARYLDNVPLLHTWDGGKSWNTGGFHAVHLLKLKQFIDEHRVSRFIETGAGNTTVTFLLSGAARVVSIAPDAELFDRIYAYCDGAEIDRSNLEPRVGFSQWELPPLAMQYRGEFDFALLDGCHGWPYVFIDFYYLSALVRPMGFLMIDDLQLHSVSELVRWANEQVDLTPVLDLGKAVVLRKGVAADFGEWTEQPYIVRNSQDNAIHGTSDLHTDEVNLRQRLQAALQKLDAIQGSRSWRLLAACKRLVRWLLRVARRFR